MKPKKRHSQSMNDMPLNLTPLSDKFRNLPSFLKLKERNQEQQESLNIIKDNIKKRNQSVTKNAVDK